MSPRITKEGLKKVAKEPPFSKFRRFVRGDDLVTGSGTHADIAKAEGIDSKKVKDAGFFTRHFVQRTISVYGGSGTLNVPENNSNRPGTIKDFQKIAGDSGVEIESSE